MLKFELCNTNKYHNEEVYEQQIQSIFKIVITVMYYFAHVRLHDI